LPLDAFGRGAPGLDDLWIACHALTWGLTVVTHNEREFLRAPELKFENWAKE
jgi:tRNA(fMet)-specific endonuclease VapC